MHEHHHGALTGPAWILLAGAFAIGNLGITAAYAAIPRMVLPWLTLPRDTRRFARGFFVLCGTTHGVMALTALTVGPAAVVHGVPAPPFWMALFGVMWTAVHLAQAGVSWGFILCFRRDLVHAQQLTADPRPPRGAVPGGV